MAEYDRSDAEYARRRKRKQTGEAISEEAHIPAGSKVEFCLNGVPVGEVEKLVVKTTLAELVGEPERLYMAPSTLSVLQRQFERYTLSASGSGPAGGKVFTSFGGVEICTDLSLPPGAVQYTGPSAPVGAELIKEITALLREDT